ncbi:hypothetical protein J8I26_08450 [Herbaspirillum sp. LeCh32-8]|uniref:hypothetical protein n=1 Tax=Herbaspirillum sp. LeCh32-8 TaxID=2821356 RepID=UPI001AE851C5|nr:hypothetical protein [Herbaspirillum sp. LeCh32-8]MBP0598128.1 hypothetical protein [Herbaspirillum sp. LeCh32-8]
MNQQTRANSDRALDDRPDSEHAPEPGVKEDKLGDARGKGRTGLEPGGASDAEQMLDQELLKRPRDGA